MAIKLNKRTIDHLAPTDDLRGKRYYDSEISGLGITVYPSGKKVFFIQYGPTSRRRKMVLGAYGTLTPEDARILARKKLAEVLNGEDPLEAKSKRQEIPAFRDWVKEYLEKVGQRKKHPGEDERYLRWATEQWGNKPIIEITADDISRLYHRIVAEGHKIAANRFHASLSACLQTAWRLGKIDSNPVLKVEKLPENPPRDRVMSDAEMAKMLQAIDEIPNPHLKAAFVLLVHTGARRSEVLNARWQDFDLESKIWRLPSTKSGRTQYIPLTEELAEMLRALPRMGDYVLPGADPSKKRFDLKRPWQKLLEKVGTPDLHIHDLRRSFGLAIARQAGLHVASRLLRHSNVSITAAVYAPLGLDELREALEERGKVIQIRGKASQQGE